MSASNSIGSLVRLSTFGESHGAAIGGILDGLPSGFGINRQHIDAMLLRRSTHQSFFGSARNEPDEIDFLSGLDGDVTNGAPLAFIIRNTDHRPEDYKSHSQIFRPSHADYTYYSKYGKFSSGGGRASARETAVRVVAGAIAMQILAKSGIDILAFVKSIGDICLPDQGQNYSAEAIDASAVRCPDNNTSKKMLEELQKASDAGDTLGGVIHCLIRNCPPGLGEPVYNKMNAALSFSMMSIPSVKGIEFGSGFAGASQKGSAQNDAFILENGIVKTLTNHSGGIQGGISNGADIEFNVAFKPVSSIKMKQQTIDQEGHTVELELGGRHDVCVVPRAVPIVESMAALVILDFWLMTRIYKNCLGNE